MTTYSYEVSYESTPKNKSYGKIDADTPAKAIKQVEAIYYAQSVKVNVWPYDGNADVCALVENNGPGIRKVGPDPDAP